MRDIDRRFSVWLTGYYEDFQSMRVIAEGEDYANLDDFFDNRRDSHAGNTMSALAYNNPRFIFDFLIRDRGNRVPQSLIGTAAASAAATLHNEGPSQWLTADPNRISFSTWEGRSQLTYPDTIGDAASIRSYSQPRRADYSHFASGWGTENTYWVRHGDLDSTYDHDSLTVTDAAARPWSVSTRGYAKYELAAPNTGTPSDPSANVMHSSNLAGVVMGEQGEASATSPSYGEYSYAHLHPIKSPSGKPFFVHRHARRVSDWIVTTGVTSNGGFNQYQIDEVNEFDAVGSLGADDVWFTRETTSLTYTLTTNPTAGDPTITIPAALTPDMNPLDPSNDRTLPNKTGTPKHILIVDADILYYTSFADVGGDLVFTLDTPLASSYTTPTVGYSKLSTNIASDVGTLRVYNLTTAGTPDLEDVLPEAYDVDVNPALKPRIFFKNPSTNIVKHGDDLRHNDRSFSTQSNSALGYTYYYVDVFQVLMDSDTPQFNDSNITGGPYTGQMTVLGDVAVGDYIMVQGQAAPEKVTDVSDSHIVTDGVFTSNPGAGRLRVATYGSYVGNQGRPLDGMHGYQPVIVGDSALNASANGERFTIRMAVQSFDHQTGTSTAAVDMSYRLAVGYDQTESGFDLNERGNMTGSKAAITHDFRLSDGTGLSGSKTRLFKMFSYGAGSKTDYTLDQLWFDLDIVVNFDTQQYWVFDDGTNVGGPQNFNAKPGGGSWSASDLYGWSLGVNIIDEVSIADTDKWATVITMIDRAAWTFALSDRLNDATIPVDMPTDDFIVTRFKHRAQADSISSLELEISDDENDMRLPQLYSGRPDWRVQVFRDSDYRPIFSSLISAVEFKQSADAKTKTINVKARDSIGELDFQFPYFDIGQYEGMPSAQSGYRRYEVEAYSRAFYFGTASLLTLNQFLGMDKFSVGSTGEYLPRYDQRMRLYSGHPIQIYGNEEVNGPNHVEDAWEVSRIIDHFEPDPVDSTKTLVVLKSDALPWGDDLIPNGMGCVIKGNWRNVGHGSSVKSLPENVEKGYLSLGTGITSPEATAHNTYRGSHTVLQRQTVTTTTHSSGTTTLIVDDTSLFPSSGTLTIDGATSVAYSSKGATTFTLSAGLSDDLGPGSVVKEVTTYGATDLIIDVEFQRAMRLKKVDSNGGYVELTLETDPSFNTAFEFMGGTGYASDDSVFAKNDLIRTDISPDPESVRVWVQPNAAGIAYDSNLADLPTQVYQATEIVSNSFSTNRQVVIKTNLLVSTLSAGLQAALPVGPTTDIGDALECDLGYLSVPKKRDSTWTLRNVGNGYIYRDSHARWVRDLAQSLWFQKTFGVIKKNPYGHDGVTFGGGARVARTTLAANFDTENDSYIELGDVANFPFSGVCEIWSSNPTVVGGSDAVMLTSFAYVGKTTSTNRLNGVMFADTNQGVITATGAVGSRYVVCRDISADYKHMFALFADMRNDGSADADGGARKEDFGLIHPVPENYKVSVVWAETGQSFVDLKIGQDCDIWSASALNDPAGTATAGSTKSWSEYPTAVMLDYDVDTPMLVGKRSDQTELHTHLQSWEDKAGAFVLVDLSKFFNLNTEANNGRCFQNAGGNKPLGQLIVDQAGTPTLIDSYWYHASSNYQNADDPIIKHQNQYRWVTAKTTLTQDITVSTPIGSTTTETAIAATTIDVADNTPFPPSGTLIINGDTFAFTGKGGKINSLVAYQRGSGYSSGTWTTTGGGGSGATGNYTCEFEIANVTGTGTGYGPVSPPGTITTGAWYANGGNAKGTWRAVSGVITDWFITTNGFYESAPTITVDPGTTGGTGATATANMESTGRVKSYTVTSGGTDYDSQPTIVFSSGGTGATAVSVLTATQLTGVTGIGATHPAGSTITMSATFDTLYVEDTSDFPPSMGVSTFAGQSTAGKIEAKTTDASGNQATIEYVFSYTSKTATSFLGVKYRPVRQGETVDVAAAGLWTTDTFTVAGVPAMLADGTVIRGSLGAAFPMGFMLSIEGSIKTANSGSYHEHDKIRIFQTSALFNDWFKQNRMPALSDINNVPILHDFNVDGATDGTGTVESFGSVTDARNKSVLSTLRTMAAGAGVGDGGSLLTLNFQMGRDNRMEFRPTYNAGHSLTRNNLKVSDLKSSKQSTFTHVRVLFNGGLSFVDHPELTYRGNHRFRFVDASDVASYEQALDIAKMEYQKRKTAAFSVEAEVIRQSNETQRDGPMLANARYGYIADPARQTIGPYGAWWSALRGGSPFPGMCNALHGNVHGYGLLNLLTYSNETVIGIGIGGYAGAGDYTTTYGDSNAFYPTNDLYNQFPWTQFYYWYGAASVSHAVQIVHVPKGMPKVSETTGNELRVFISDEASSLPVTGRLTDNVADKLFGIHLGDYTFLESYSGSNTPSLWSEQRGIESITVKGNGYFEIDVPESYWAAGNAAGYKMVLSVNADYLSALARHKCGDQFGGNAITTPVGSAYVGQTKPTFPNSNEFSIFPLGIRTYPEMGAYADERSMWYAPRIHVIDDINFLPGTYAAYTDDRLDIDETMLIQSVSYEYSPKKLDRTVLKLERELGRMPLGLEGYLATNPFNDTGGQGPPAGGGGASQGNGNTGGRSFPGGQGSDYLPNGPESFPGGYTGGQVGTSLGGDFAALVGGDSADLGNVLSPTFGGENAQRLNRDLGIQQTGQFAAQQTRQTDANALSKSVVNRMTGSLSLDSVLPSAIQGIPGQPKPTIVPPKQRAMEGVDTKFLSSQGQATPTDDGWMLPGASQLDDSEAVTNLAHGVKMQATMPKDVAHPVVGIEAFISCDLGPASNKTISLTTTMTCPDTGESISHTYEETIASSISRKSVQLLPTQLFQAAATEGRNITVEIVRKPNQGNDDADYSAVIINGIQVTNTVHNNQGRTQSSDLLPFSGDSLNTTDANASSLSLNSDADPLA